MADCLPPTLAVAVVRPSLPFVAAVAGRRWAVVAVRTPVAAVAHRSTAVVHKTALVVLVGSVEAAAVRTWVVVHTSAAVEQVEVLLVRR